MNQTNGIVCGVILLAGLFRAAFRPAWQRRHLSRSSVPAGAKLLARHVKDYPQFFSRAATINRGAHEKQFLINN
jgi:hypothetical protein